MLAVSAQCGCCHHWFSFNIFLLCPFIFGTSLSVPVFVCLLALLCLFSCDITWSIYYRDCGLYFGGCSYSSVYVPPPLYVFPVVPMYSYIFFSSLLCFVCLFLSSHMPLVLLLPICVSFLHAWMKTFGGVCICILSYAAICGF